MMGPVDNAASRMSLQKWVIGQLFYDHTVMIPMFSKSIDSLLVLDKRCNAFDMRVSVRPLALIIIVLAFIKYMQCSLTTE
jgi:hypothetical protein